MKRILTIFCLLLGAAAASQAQEGRVAARLGTPFDAHIYTFLDGEFGEHFSYSICNHWVSGEGTPDLYRNAWKSSDCNWCDWANLTYSIGGFAITAGKDVMLNGLYEFIPCDVDTYPILCSSYWNNVNSYQLGAKASYTVEAIGTTALLQFNASPFDERPFGGHSAISFGLKGDFGVFQPYYALNRITMSEDDWGLEKLFVLTLGNRFQINDDFLFHVDYLGKFAPGASSATSILAGLEYSFLDGMKLTARAGCEKSEGPICEALGFGDTGFLGGLAFEFRPLSFLRFHAAGSYDQNIGARYDFGVLVDFSFSK